MVQYFVFDVFGTLLQEAPKRLRTYEIVALFTRTHPRQAKLVIEPYYSRLDLGHISPEAWAKEVLSKLGCSAADGPALLERLRKSRSTSHDFIDGALTALARAGTGQRPVGLLSNLSAIQWPTLSHHNLTPGGLVTHAVYSFFNRCAKPDPAAFALIAAQMGLAPSQCTMLDDTVACIVGAARAGMDGTLLLHRPGTAARKLLRHHQYDQTIARIKWRKGLATVPLHWVHGNSSQLGVPDDYPIRVALSLEAATA